MVKGRLWWGVRLHAPLIPGPSHMTRLAGLRNQGLVLCRRTLCMLCCWKQDLTKTKFLLVVLLTVSSKNTFPDTASPCNMQTAFSDILVSLEWLTNPTGMKALLLDVFLPSHTTIFYKVERCVKWASLLYKMLELLRMLYHHWPNLATEGVSCKCTMSTKFGPNTKLGDEHQIYQ